MNQFKIDETRCIQCGECATDCPAGVIAMQDYPVMTDEEGCIRCQHCLAVCPTAAVSILDRDPDMSIFLKGNLPGPLQMAALIKGRRSVRRYQEANVPADLLDELLETAWHAPTGVNNQGVLFTVVRDRTVLASLRQEVHARVEKLAAAGGLPEGMVGRYLSLVLSAWKESENDVLFRGAPHLLITSSPASAPCPVQDAHIALATFDLLAQSRGLGTLWDGIFMMALGLFPDLTRRLGIPEDHLVGYAMVFGLPAVQYHRTVQRGPARLNVVK